MTYESRCKFIAESKVKELFCQLFSKLWTNIEWYAFVVHSVMSV